ncbi:unnamed protein product [Mytilus coruscus]|uniref:SGNH hydrolase-type esterase domain-containing protein n=1 Tax=Mytilus coruscus TaxID=42192 RepID=A0A6J8BQG2_MYTCO|nr:unnamed protein product [Mytilus coruscus]
MSTLNIDSELNDTSTFDSFSFSDSEVLPNVSNQRKQRKSKKIPNNEEVTTDFQFDRFGDEGNAIRVPCGVKFGTSVNRFLWIESFKEVMSENFIVTEKLFKNGVQLQCMYKGNTGTKFVSTTFYTNGIILVQGKHTCTEWRDTYFSKIKDKVNYKENEVSNTLRINDGQTHQKDVLPENDSMIDSQTVPKDISSIQDNTIIHQNVNTASNSTAEPSDQPHYHSFPDNVVNLLQSLNLNISTLTSQNATLIQILHDKETEINKLRHECEESKGSDQILQVQISRLSSELKLANQTIKGLHDEIEILSKQPLTDIIHKKAVQRVQTPKQKVKSTNHASFNSGILSSSTPIVEQRPIIVDKEHISQSKTALRQKLKLKIRSNQTSKSIDNILILGSSIIKGIKTKNLKEKCVNTNRGATISDFEKKIAEIDFSPFSTIVLQFGGNDAKMREEVFKSKYKNVVQSARMNGISNIIIGGCLPRSKTNLNHINKALIEISKEEKIKFIRHMDNFVLRNGEIVPGLISTDGVHLTQAGTEKLIDNINRVIKIRSASVNLSNCICNLRPSTNDSKSCTNGNKYQSKVSIIKNDQNASDQENINTRNYNVYGHSEKGIKLTCHNIQHILPKIDEIRSNFESLGKTQRPDIIGMCETFLNTKKCKRDSNKINIPGYSNERKDRENKKSTNPTSLINVTVPSYAPGDHYPVSCTVNKFAKLIKDKSDSHYEIKYRNFKTFNDEMFLQDLSNQPFDIIHEINDPNEAMDMWYYLLVNVLDKHAPVVTRRVKNKYQPEWYTNEIGKSK